MTVDKFTDKLERWMMLSSIYIKDEFMKQAPLLEKNIKYNYLSGQVLNVRTGRLRKSIKAEVRMLKGNPGLRVSEAGISDKGFHYGAHWMTHGRDFMTKPTTNAVERVTRLIGKRLVEELTK